MSGGRSALIGGLAVVLIAGAAYWFVDRSRSAFEGETVALDVDTITPTSASVSVQLTMNDHVAVEGRGVAVVDARTGEATAVLPAEDKRFAVPTVVHIGPDGSALFAAGGRQQKFYRLTGDSDVSAIDISGLPGGTEFAGRLTVVGTTTDAVAISACIDDDEYLAGLNPATGQVIWSELIDDQGDPCRNLAGRGLRPSTHLPFSFHLDGQPSAGVIDLGTGEVVNRVDGGGGGPSIVFGDVWAVLDRGVVTARPIGSDSQLWTVEVCPSGEPAGFVSDPAIDGKPAWWNPADTVVAFCGAGDDSYTFIDLATGEAGPVAAGIDPTQREGTFTRLGRTVVTIEGDAVVATDILDGGELWRRSVDDATDMWLKATSGAGRSRLIVAAGGSDAGSVQVWDSAGEPIVITARHDTRAKWEDGTVLVIDDSRDTVHLVGSAVTQ